MSVASSRNWPNRPRSTRGGADDRHSGAGTPAGHPTVRRPGRAPSRHGAPAGIPGPSGGQPGYQWRAVALSLPGLSRGPHPTAAGRPQPQLCRCRGGHRPPRPDRRTRNRIARASRLWRPTMNPEHLTQKSQEALHEAQTVALRMGHPEVDNEHLLLALIDQTDGLVPSLLAATGADVAGLRAGVQQDLEKRPRVSGHGGAPGEVMVTQRLSRLLDTAEHEADRMKDEYVSVEHLLIALLKQGAAGAAGDRLIQQGVTLERVLEALSGGRGDQRVTSAVP